MRIVQAKIWEKGRCRDADTEIFYPPRESGKYRAVADAARAYCRGPDGTTPCPVLLECLFYGLVTNDGFGIWGGMSSRERNALRRSGDLSRYRPAHGLESTHYYRLITNYLEQQHAEQEAEDDQER